MQSQLANIFGITQATAAVTPKAEFPLEADIQLAGKKDERVNKIRAQQFYTVGVLGERPEAVGKLDRQKQRGSSSAGRSHMHPTALKYQL
jgi:hypothetical protein